MKVRGFIKQSKMSRSGDSPSVTLTVEIPSHLFGDYKYHASEAAKEFYPDRYIVLDTEGEKEF